MSPGGRYSLVLQFTATGRRPLSEEVWNEKLPKFQSFFGPGIEAKLAFPGPVRL